MCLCLISASACVNRGEVDERKPKTAPHCLLDGGLEVSVSSEKQKKRVEKHRQQEGGKSFQPTAPSV